MRKAELRTIYEQWAREEIEIIELVEAVGRYLGISKKEEVPHHLKPVAIWHAGDAYAFYTSSPDEKDAWNAYAQAEADKAQARLDTYETIHGLIGTNRDGKITSWCPPLFFPEWLEQYRLKSGGR